MVLRVSDGAMQLMRMAGANSAASATVSPSTAPLAAAIAAWLVKPARAAMEENNTTEPRPAASASCAA